MRHTRALPLVWVVVALAGVHLAAADNAAAAAVLGPKLSWAPGDPATPVATEPGRNLLYNSSFEQGLNGWSTQRGSEYSDREPDSAASWHGGSSCRVESSGEEPAGLTLASPIFRAEAGQEYTVSCYARADTPGLTLRLAFCNTAWQPQFAEALPLTGKWQRVQATGKAGDTRRQTYFITITVEGLKQGQSAWLDAVQVERGSLSDYRPSCEVELGAGTDRFANVFYWGDEVVLRPVVANWGAQPQQARLQYSLRDYTGQEVRDGELNLTCPSGKATAGELALGKDWRGYGQAVFILTLPGEEGSATWRCHFATIPQPQPRTAAAERPFFGVHGDGTFARNWDLLEAIGCEIAKNYCGWDSPSPESPYQFPVMDQALEGMRRHHIVPLVCLGTGHPAWTELKGPDGNPTGALDVAAFRKYVADTVAHFKTVRLFESWNEIFWQPNITNRVELMWAAHEACKQVRPDAVMMTNVTGGLGDPMIFLQDFCRARAGRPLQALSLHYTFAAWRLGPEAGGDTMREILGRARRHVQETGGAQPRYYITESGHHPGQGMHAQGMAVTESDWIEDIFCTAQQKADWMVQTFLIALEQGVEAYCEFDWCGYAVGAPWYSWLTWNDMQPTTALPAYAVATHLLRGHRAVATLVAGSPQASVRGVILKGPDGSRTSCLWSTEGETTAVVKVKGQARSLRVVDVMGQESEVRLRAGVASLAVGEGPVYLPGQSVQLLNPVSAEAPVAGWTTGQTYPVIVSLKNPFPHTWRLKAELRLPQGWVLPPPREVALPPLTARQVRFDVTPGADGRGALWQVVCSTTAGERFCAQGRVDVIGAASAALAAREPVKVVDDFEGDLGRWGQDLPPGAALEMTPSEEVAHSGKRSLRLQYSFGGAEGFWASAVLRFGEPQPWSAYRGLSFWMYWTEKPDCLLQVHLPEEGGGTYCASVPVEGAPAQWHRVVLPLSDFKLGGFSQDPNGTLNLDQVKLFALVGGAQAGTHTLYVDDIQLLGDLPAGATG